MEEHKKSGRTLKDYAHLFLSRSIEKEKQPAVPPTISEPEEDTEKPQQPVISNEKSGPELHDASIAAASASPPQEKTDAPVQTTVEDQQTRPYAIAIACPRTSITNSFLTFNLCLDFAKRGLQVLVLNADLSFTSMNFLAALKLSPAAAALRQQGMPAEKPLPEIQLITVDTDITMLGCPWPEEHNPIIDEITSSAQKADVILINTSTGFSANAKALFKAADEILLISGFEPAHLIDTYSIIKMIHQFAPEAHIGITIIGDQTPAHAGFSKLHDASREFLNIPLYSYGCIPWDADVRHSITSKALPPADSAGSRAVHAVGELLLNSRAQRQQALSMQEPGFIEKLFITSGPATSWEKRFQSLTQYQTP